MNRQPLQDLVPFQTNFDIINANFEELYNFADKHVLTTIGDMVYCSASAVPPGHANAERLPIGQTGQVLTVVNGLPVWQAAAFINPMDSEGQMIYSAEGGLPIKLLAPTNNNCILYYQSNKPAWIGTDTAGKILTSTSAFPVWADNPAMLNPMTAAGQLIYGGTNGTPTALSKSTDGSLLMLIDGIPRWKIPGTNGLYLKMVFGYPTWTAQDWVPLSAYTTNSIVYGTGYDYSTVTMTQGGLLYGGAFGQPSILAAASQNGSILVVSGGYPTWQAPAAEGTYLKIVSGIPAWSTIPTYTNPMDAIGQLIYGGASGVQTKLAAGTAGYLLQANGAAAPTWVAASWLPLSAFTTNAILYGTGAGTYTSLNVVSGGLLYGSAGGPPAYLAPPGTDGALLSYANGAPTWRAAASNGAILVMASGLPTWLAAGSDTRYLKMVAGAPAWTAREWVPLSAYTSNGIVYGEGSDYSTVTMTAGGLLYGNDVGTPTILSAGTNGHILTLSGGLPVWAAAPASGMTNPMTTTGDMIYSSSGSTPARLAAGTAYKLLRMNSAGTAPEWSNDYPRTLYRYTGGALTVNAAGEVNLIAATIPANLLVTGSVVRGVLCGSYSTATSTPGAINFKLSYGLSLLMTTVSTTPTNNISSKPWRFEFEFRCRTAAAHPSAIFDGTMTVTMGKTASTADILMAGGSYLTGGTTADYLLEPRFTWEGYASGDSLIMSYAYVEVIP